MEEINGNKTDNYISRETMNRLMFYHEEIAKDRVKDLEQEIGIVECELVALRIECDNLKSKIETDFRDLKIYLTTK